MKKINVRLFGAFRKYIPSGTLEIEVDELTNVKSFKELIGVSLKNTCPTFNDNSLLEESAVSNSEEILSEETLVITQIDLAILPPVCGG
jgi:molybdopterin converting factor small subunit